KRLSAVLQRASYRDEFAYREELEAASARQHRAVRCRAWRLGSVAATATACQRESHDRRHDGAASCPSAGRAAPVSGRSPGALRTVHRPHEKPAAATTMVSATRIPDSPTHSVASGPVLAGSNAVWMTAFQAACSATAGQTLPVSSRRRASTKLKAVAVTIQSTAASTGGRPTR